MIINIEGSDAGTRLSLEVKGEGTFDFQNQRGRMTLGVGEEAEEVLFDAGKVYLSAPCSSGAVRGKTFVAFPVPEDAESGFLYSSDPARFLDSLHGVTPEIQTVGAEEVRVAPTTYYGARVDVQKALSQTSGETRREMEAFYKSLRTSSFPVEAWIDNEGLPRRIVLSFDGEVEGAIFKMQVSTDYFDYGTPVEIKVPPADQVLDLPDEKALAGLCVGPMEGSARGAGSGSAGGSGSGSSSSEESGRSDPGGR